MGNVADDRLNAHANHVAEKRHVFPRYLIMAWGAGPVVMRYMSIADAAAMYAGSSESIQIDQHVLLEGFAVRWITEEEMKIIIGQAD